MCGTTQRYQTLVSMRDHLEKELERLTSAGETDAQRSARAEELAVVEEELAAMAAHPDVVSGRR